jgi:uncharacterized protein (TIGR00297 family)
MIDPLVKIIGIALVFGIGYVSYRMKLLEMTGTICGVLMGVLMIYFVGIEWFLVFLIFFLLSGFFTRYKRDYKRSLGIAQNTRNYKNVLGNGLVSLCMAILYGIFDQQIFLFGFLGSVAAATGDTLATEIGETSKRKPRLITNLRRVPHGTNGAISALGEISAVFGSIIIASVSIVLMGIGGIHFVATVFGGFFGTNLDSVLGTTLEGKIFGNEVVNLIGTMAGAVIAILVYYV